VRPGSGTLTAVPDVHPYLGGPHPRAYAHRGWHVDDLAGLENTLVALQRAVEEGFCYLELDVRATADGVAVVHHDRTLDRTSDGSGEIEALPVAALSGVRVGGREPIPLLDEVLSELPDVRMTIELKAGAAVAPVLAAIDRADAWHRVCLGSYSDAWLRQARLAGGSRLCTSLAQGAAFGLRAAAWLEAAPAALSALTGLLPAAPLPGDLAQLPRRYGPVTVVDAALVRTVHRTGRELHVWTVNEPDEMVELLDLGVDGLLSDRPDLLRELLRSRDQWAA
jgi:glycerophosphoryl diester phosphodiesterase